MANQQNPQNPQQQNQQSPNERDRKDQQGDKAHLPGQKEQNDRQRQQSQGDDMVGKDTDGDGKVVKPGQQPGQSHGTGVKPNQQR